jgi:hypothetical protein
MTRRYFSAVKASKSLTDTLVNRLAARASSRLSLGETKPGIQSAKKIGLTTSPVLDLS